MNHFSSPQSSDGRDLALVHRWVLVLVACGFAFNAAGIAYALLAAS